MGTVEKDSPLEVKKEALPKGGVSEGKKDSETDPNEEENNVAETKRQVEEILKEFEDIREEYAIARAK